MYYCLPWRKRVLAFLFSSKVCWAISVGNYRVVICNTEYMKCFPFLNSNFHEGLICLAEHQKDRGTMRWCFLRFFFHINKEEPVHKLKMIRMQWELTLHSICVMLEDIVNCKLKIELLPPLRFSIDKNSITLHWH